MIPTSIDGTDITGATIDGTDVQEITVDGQTVFTAETIIDDFEDGNLTEYSGAVSSYTIQSNTVFQGSQALETTGLFDNMHRTDFVSPGDTVSVYMRNDDAQFLFGFDGSDGYLFALNTSNNAISLRRVDNSTNFAPAQFSSVSISSGVWYEAVVDYTVGNLFVELKDTSGTVLTTVTLSDSTHSNTGFGFRGRTGALWDKVTIL